MTTSLTWSCFIKILTFCFFRCRINVVLSLVFEFFLGFAIVICNATILGVLFLRNQDVRSIYRLSLALGDFIMGVVVIPINIGIRYRLLVQTPPFTELRNVSGYVIANDSSFLTQPAAVELKYLYPGKFSSSYASAIGFFDVLSLWVSVSSLVAASFDRFFAICCPLKYNKLKAKAILAAKIAIVYIWLSGLAFSLLPIVIPGTGYSVDFVNSKVVDKNPMRLVHAIALYLGVILLWFSIIATYVAARPSLRRHDRQRQTDDEMHLLGTLGVMIVVFTLCVVPNLVIQTLRYDNVRNPSDFDAATAMQLMSLDFFMKGVLISNSIWNCFIYNIRETTFQRATKLLYKEIARRLKLDQAWNLFTRKK